ncbi:hypothetical protein U1Q18_003412 [Sarracenia purpurea var. burkii]
MRSPDLFFDQVLEEKPSRVPKHQCAEETRAPALQCERSPRATREIIDDAISVRSSLRDWMKSGSFDKECVPVVRAEMRSLNSELTEFCKNPLLDSARMAALEARIQRMKLISPVMVDPRLETHQASVRENVPMEEAEAIMAAVVYGDKVSEGDLRDCEEQKLAGEIVVVGEAEVEASNSGADSENPVTDDDFSDDSESGSSEIDEDDVVVSGDGSVKEILEFSEDVAVLPQGNKVTLSDNGSLNIDPTVNGNCFVGVDCYKEAGLAPKTNLIGHYGGKNVDAHQVLDENAVPRTPTPGSVNADSVRVLPESWAKIVANGGILPAHKVIDKRPMAKEYCIGEGSARLRFPRGGPKIFGLDKWEVAGFFSAQSWRLFFWVGSSWRWAMEDFED